MHTINASLEGFFSAFLVIICLPLMQTGLEAKCDVYVPFK